MIIRNCPLYSIHDDAIDELKTDATPDDVALTVTISETSGADARPISLSHSTGGIIEDKWNFTNKYASVVGFAFPCNGAIISGKLDVPVLAKVESTIGGEPEADSSAVYYEEIKDAIRAKCGNINFTGTELEI